MADVTAAIHRRFYWSRLSRCARLISILSAALGVFFWTIERDWHSGAWAAISLWILLGLMAQVHDLWRNPKGSGILTPEERWGWRFAIAWRLAIACLMVAYFVVLPLFTWKILTLNDGDNLSNWGVSGVALQAILFISMIVAIASAPRFARKGERRSWSWAVELLGYIASAVLCVFLLMECFVIAVLVHVTIVGIQAAWPLKFAPDFLATYGPARTGWFFDVATAGVVSVVVSCVLLRLLSIHWWQAGRQRIYLGALLATSLTITILLADRIAMVKVPAIAPIFVANTPMPGPHRLLLAGVLALLLVSAVARRWSDPAPIGFVARFEPWRRDEGRYYHERRITIFLLAGVMLAWLLGTTLPPWEWMFRYCLAGWVTTPQGCLSLAIISLAVQSMFSGRPECSGVVPVERPRLAPGLFMLNLSVLLTIVIFSAPILAAWGFALWFHLP